MNYMKIIRLKRHLLACGVMMYYMSSLLAGAQFEHSPNAVRMDPDPNVPASDDQPAEGGIGYTWSVELDAGQSAFVTGHVGAWSWQDEALFDSSLGEEPVGWTHTSNWLFLDLKKDAWVTVRHQREEGIPWPSPEDPERTASTKTMNPSFTIFAGYDGDGADNHTWNNDGEVEWAEDITYLDHINNSVAGIVEKSWFLTAGSYTLALGSNAPSNDTDRQGYRTWISTGNSKPEPSLFLNGNGTRITFNWSLGYSGYALQAAESVDFLNPAWKISLIDDSKIHEVPTDSNSMFFRLIEDSE